MNISETFIRRPVGTWLLSAALLAVGIVAYLHLPVSALPVVDFPTLQVGAALPGASPETMASNVATPLERQFSLIPGITQMTSSSSLGQASITLQFELSRNIDGAAQDVQSAINAAGGQLPTNLPAPPTVRKVNPADDPIMIIVLTSDTLPLTSGHRLRRQPAGAAALAHRRRRTGVHRGRSASPRCASASIRARPRSWDCSSTTSAPRLPPTPSTRPRACSPARCTTTRSTPTIRCSTPPRGIR